MVGLDDGKNEKEAPWTSLALWYEEGLPRQHEIFEDINRDSPQATTNFSSRCVPASCLLLQDTCTMHPLL